MLKKIIFIILTYFFLTFPKPSLAFKAETFVTFNNPVRGPEGWQSKTQTPLDLPRFQYKEATFSAFPVTWSLRFDAVQDATISAFFASLISQDKTQSLGVLLEITPGLTKAANVGYPNGFSPFNANRIFLSGYSIRDRESLIDTYMSAFFSRFGFYPATVTAWHLDSYSLQYLQSRYSILTAMICDDQYGTDSYRFWGGYLGSPYFPDKNNSLVPASNFNNRINLTMVRWAQRDLFNFYGPLSESNYSIQANDYTAMGQTTAYFERMLKLYGQKGVNEFTYINIGLENDYPLEKFRNEIKNVYRVLNLNKDKYNLHYISLSDFGDWFKARYPESSPAYYYETDDLLNQKPGKVYWYQTPFYRLGLRSYGGKSEIFDFRVYNRDIYEDYFATPNQDVALSHEIPAVVDTVKFPGTEVVFFESVNTWEFVHSKQWDYWSATLEKDGKKIIFRPDSLVFSGFTPPQINSQDIKIEKSGEGTVWKMTPQTPFKKTSKPTWLLWLLLAGIFFFLYKKKSKLPIYLFVSIAIALIAVLTLFRSGWLYPYGLGFWGPNGHDAIFHLSFIEKFTANPFSFSHPQITGEKIANYHFLFDFLAGIFVKISGISSLDFYFRVFPTIASLAIVYLLDRLLLTWRYSRQERVLAFLFVFFAGSFGFIARLFMGQDIFSGESAFWSNQSVSIFLNPPFALSIIDLLFFLNVIARSESDAAIYKNKTQFFFLSLLGGLLAQTKIYAFILLLAGLLFSKKYKIFVGVLITGILISLPFTKTGSGFPFVFSPLWFSRSLFASYDRVHWPRLVSAWQTYEASGSLIKLALVNLFALTVFYLGNLGVRIFGLFEFYKKPHDTSELIGRWIVIFGLLIPLLFIQSVNPWNTIQFLYYSLFFLGIYTAKVISKFHPVLIILILPIAVFTSIGTLKDYISFFSASRISYTELQALNTLKGQPGGLILSPLYSFSAARPVAEPKPLYAYVSTAYVSALTGQPEFLSDTINLDITGYDYKEKSRQIQRFYNTKDIQWAAGFLRNNKIKYIYETPLQKIKVSPGELGLVKIFDSGEITIYKHVIPDLIGNL